MNEWGRLSEKELSLFKSLEDLQVIFDIGVRENTDYLELKPNAEFHLFEPNSVFYKNLEDRISKLPPFMGTVHINNYGLGEIEKHIEYDVTLQSFKDSEAKPGGCDAPLLIKTLDWYVEANNIICIDFLKIDTEGYDLKVLQGGAKAIEMTRYIQLEMWDNYAEFESLLGARFNMKDMGDRNIFCTRK